MHRQSRFQGPKKYLLVMLLFASPARAENAINQLSDAERRGGWQLLFDGKTSVGWRNYRQQSISEGWQVQEGALVRVMDGAGDIISNEQFEKFELSLEYRITPGGNSGIGFHITEELPRALYSGPEIQVLDNRLGHDEQKAGWLYQLYQPVVPNWVKEFDRAVGRTSSTEVDATRPAGHWNHIYLRVAKQSEVALNGVSYFHFQKGNDEWKERVAKSKFANSPKFGLATKGHICLQDHGDTVAYRNIKVRILREDETVPDPIDGTLPIQAEVAFPQLQWDQWSPEDEQGRLQSLRIIQLTHAGDGSHRLFAAAQNGMIQVFQNNAKATKATMFCDLRPKVLQWASKAQFDEHGLLGLAFHPNYSKNGQFFVSYSSQDEPHICFVSRFCVSANNPDRADPQSEEILLRLEQPYPNHNGGSIEFGPDGFLYIGLGDGGSRNDPHGLSQDLTSWMGKILRIDVDHRQNGRPYAIPKDNPFIHRDKAQPEIFAYGFRNIWRIAFDPPTETLWAADVGQDLWEEVNIIRKGGNYGWSLREGTHLFGANPAAPADPMIDPVWEYDHRVGVSVTGGRVYRGKQIPTLQGIYLYGDYAASKVWGLKFDPTTHKVTANFAVAKIDRPVIAFGQDADGEIYCLTPSASGHCIHRFKQIAATAP